MATLASFVGSYQRRELLDTRTTLESLVANDWPQFELLVEEASRRAYSVQEAGLVGEDGGIDLILRNDGLPTLVQCKQWKRLLVGVGIVREMYGLLAYRNVDLVKTVRVCTYIKWWAVCATQADCVGEWRAAAGKDPGSAGPGECVRRTFNLDCAQL